jgi:PKD repeat protein
MKQKNSFAQMALFRYVLLLVLLCGNKLVAQTISITPESEVGCQLYSVEDRKKYAELIEQYGSCTRICEYSTVTYTLSGNPSTWVNTAWNITGGTLLSSSLQQCTVSWGGTGLGVVGAQISTQNGIINVADLCVQIVHAPSALFTVSPTQPGDELNLGCINQTIYFTNLSTPNGGSDLVSYYWEFGNGDTSSAFEPSYVYTQPGSYDVTLTVTNACNCKNKYRLRITVDAGGSNISCPSVSCEGQRATYTINGPAATGCPTFEWSVSGGTIVSPMPYGPTIQVDWDNVDETGFGYVYFDARHCDVPCPTIISVKIPVIKNLGTITGNTDICEGQQYRYTLPQWPGTVYSWNLQDNGTGSTVMQTDQPNEVVLTADGGGTIVLNVSYQNTLYNCGGTASLTINVKPQADIIGENQICEGVYTYSLSGGLSGDWILTTPTGSEPYTGSSITYNFTPGAYTLQVSGSDFCAPDDFVINVYETPPAPNAITGLLVVCPGIPITYTFANTVNGTDIGWDVVGGEIIGNNYGEEVTIKFDPSATPPYYIKTWREGSSAPYCASDTLTTTVNRIVVNAPINGNSSTCSSSDSNYSTPYADAEVYNWYVQDQLLGSVSAGNGTQNITIDWNQVAVNTTTNVVLQVTKCGVVYTSTFAVTIVAAPAITITGPTTMCRGADEVFTISSVPALTSGTITWDFGDGNSVTTNAATPGGLSVSYDYDALISSNANYTLTVTVAQPNGCSSASTATHITQVLPAPVAFISPSINQAFCTAAEINVNFVATVQSGYGSTSGIEWYRGATHLTALDGNYSVVINSSYGFGTYYARVYNANGCYSDTNEVKIIQNCGTTSCTITPAPTVTMSAANTCGVIAATASYTGSPSISWTPSPGMTTVSQNNTAASYTVSQAGSYDLYYTATYSTPSGPCAKQVHENIIVPYLADIRYTATCGATAGYYNVTLLDHSNFFAPTPIDTYTFFVDNVQVYSGPNTSFPVTLSAGSHTIKVTVSGSGYPQCSKQITIVLPPAPTTPAITYSSYQTCQNEAVAFQTPAQAGNTYLWDFGDGTFSTQQNPSRLYATAGIYDVTLTVTNSGGCTATNVVAVEILEVGGNGSLQEPPIGCVGSASTITFLASAPGAALFTWMEGTNVLGTTTTGSFDVYQNGLYWVEVTDTNGCKSNISGVTATFIKPPVAGIEGVDAVCAGASFELTGTGGKGDFEFQWLLNGSPVGPYSNNNVLEQTLTTAGTYTYTLNVRIETGDGGYCTDSAMHTIVVYPAPLSISMGFDMLDCDAYRLKLWADTGQPGTYTWSNGDSGQAITIFEGGPYRVTFTNSSGCSITSQVYVPKNPEVYMWLFPSGCYQFCGDPDGIVLPAPVPVFNEWVWYKNGNASLSGQNSAPSPYTVTTSGAYELSLDNGLCVKTSLPMDVDIQQRCKCEVKADMKKIKVVEDEFCYYTMDIFIDNPTGAPISVTVTAPSGAGIFQPAAVSVPPGGAVVALNLIPTGFSGGLLTLTFEYLNPDGTICRSSLVVNFPELCKNKFRTTSSSNDVALTIAPNPVKSTAHITFSYTESKGSVRTIEIYSLMGVCLERFEPKSLNGVWEPNLGSYASGQYIVVMKEDGAVLQQKYLILQ